MSRGSKRDPLTTSVVACRWERTNEGWRLWVKGRTNISGFGPTYEEAERALLDAIFDAAPDPDAIMPTVPVFTPPLPASAFAEPYLTPELYKIGGDEPFEIYAPSSRRIASPEKRAAYLQSVFTGGICPTCRHGRGERSSVPLRVDDAPPRVDAGFVSAPFSDLIRVYSERFIHLLTPQEREHLRFRPIELPTGSRRRFFELCGPPDVAYVGVSGFDNDGLECPECGYRMIEAMDPRLLEGSLRLQEFICAADLPPLHLGCFTTGVNSEIKLCAARERWDVLREHPHARGVFGDPLGVVGEEECDRHPRIWSYRLRCENCAGLPEPRALDGTRCGIFDLPTNKCDQQNFSWVAEAEQQGLILRSRCTMEPMDMWQIVSSGERPRQTEFMSFRCPECWGIGWLVLGRTQLKLIWNCSL